MLTCGTPLVVEGARARVSINGPKRMANYPGHIASCLYPYIRQPFPPITFTDDNPSTLLSEKNVMNGLIRSIRNFLSYFKELDKSYT